MALKTNIHVAGKDDSLKEITFLFFKERLLLVNINYKLGVYNML